MADSKERGQVAPLLALVVAVGCVLVMMLMRLGENATDQAKAQTAADAAALGGAIEGEAAAEELARANGADLIAFTAGPDDVVVTVAVGRAEGQARAVVRRRRDGVAEVDCARSIDSWQSESPAVTRSPRSVAGGFGDKAGEDSEERSPEWATADECGASSAESTRGASSG